MSLNPELKTINCTACGAGLDVLGGGRVTTHICPYCGTALDTLDNYRVLQKFDVRDRPDSPFKIGMGGNLYGVDYTVIGTLEHEEHCGARRWTWIDHQLFSPTHGYAWLTLEDGHLTFSRRYRKPVKWMSEAWIERAETQPKVRSEGSVFRYYETSTSTVIFAEGEFTWAPQKGAKTTTVSAMSDASMLSFSETGSEREIYHSVYLDKTAAAKSFGIPSGLTPRGVHALQPLKVGANAGFLIVTGLGAMAACLLLALFMVSQNGEVAPGRQNFSLAELPLKIPFEVTRPGRLTRIDLRGNARNTWSYFAVELEDPEGETLFESGRTVEYYQGRDKDGNWSEGSNSATLAFFPPVAGSYTLLVDLEEDGVWVPSSPNVSASQRPMTQLELRVRNGVSSGFWLVVLALGFAGVGGFPLMRRFLHNKMRWRGSDWVDEDED